MMKQTKALAVMTAVMLLTSLSLFSGHAEEKSIINKNEKKITLTVQSVVEYLLSNNYDVKKALLAYKSIGTNMMNYNSRYDPLLFAQGVYSYSKNPNDSTVIFQGESTTYGGMGAGLTKYFNTGTRITGKISTEYQNMEGAGSPLFEIGGEGYQSSISIELAQDLMKNCFGMVDRLTEKKLSNQEWIEKQVIRFALSRLLVDAIVGYWSVAVADETLTTSQLSLKSTKEIRDLIQKKLKIGLAEREDILEWNGRALDSTNNVDRSEKALFDARLAVLRTLDLDPDIDIILGKTFSTDKPDISYEEALKDAFIRRVDWNTQKVVFKNAELEYKAAANNLLPSLLLKGSFSNRDYTNGSWEKSIDDFNEEYGIGLNFSYPLGDRAGKARMRSARLSLQQQYLETKNMEKEIRDEVLSIIKECDVSYKVFIQTKESTELKRQYYEQVLRNFNRGQYSALKVKLALDDYIMARTKELQNKVNYNIALLKREFSRNVIFERFGIDIDAILKRVEN